MKSHVWASGRNVQIVDMVRRAGARKVYLASASPPVVYPNVYGVDMPSRKEFVADGLTIDQVWRHCLTDVTAIVTEAARHTCIGVRGSVPIRSPSYVIACTLPGMAHRRCSGMNS